MEEEVARKQYQKGFADYIIDQLERLDTANADEIDAEIGRSKAVADLVKASNELQMARISTARFVYDMGYGAAASKMIMGEAGAHDA